MCLDEVTFNQLIYSILKISHLQPFKHQLHKMVKHTQTICWLLPTNCLSVYDHFVGWPFCEVDPDRVKMGEEARFYTLLSCNIKDQVYLTNLSLRKKKALYTWNKLMNKMYIKSFITQFCKVFGKWIILTNLIGNFNLLTNTISWVMSRRPQ